MALGTYAQLQASIAAWATRSDLTATIPDFVTWAHEEICRRLRCGTMLVSASATVATETMAAPTDFAAVSSFYLILTPRRKLQINTAAGIQDLISSTSTATYPTDVAVEGVNFRFGPLFSGSAAAQILYFARPTTLVNATDTNVILTKYPYLYLYGALEALFRYLEDDNNADRYGAQFGGLIESINMQEAKDALSGPLAAGRPSGFAV